jgi:hypothetical protein
VEDILIDQGKDLWSHLPFSERWEKLQECWNRLPAEQPLLALTPRVVTPISLDQWEHHYDFAIYWMIQPDHARQPRWFWKDVVTVHSHASVRYVAPQLKRDKEMIQVLYASCSPYSSLTMPDLYGLESQEGMPIGLAGISSMEISRSLRSYFSGKTVSSVPVEVVWNESFQKYQIRQIMPAETPITTASFFHHSVQEATSP